VHVTYQVVEHDGGWAYRVGDVFSETFPTHQAAHEAAEAAAARQQLGGDTGVIEYEDRGGDWHLEVTSGGDRPETSVADDGASGSAADAEKEDEQGDASG
jgi:hypothetical protein